MTDILKQNYAREKMEAIVNFRENKKKNGLRRQDSGTSLVVQWLRLSIPNARGLGSIPGQGTRSHLPQLRVSML